MSRRGCYYDVPCGCPHIRRGRVCVSKCPNYISWPQARLAGIRECEKGYYTTTAAAARAHLRKARRLR